MVAIGLLQVAAVWRSVCGVTRPVSPASLAALRNPVFTEETGLPLNSTMQLAINFWVPPSAQVGK
jgi:hypothetical protein